MNKGKIINFYQNRRIFFTISLAIMLAGVIAIFVNGIQLDIQFKGGSLLKYSFSGQIDTEDAGDLVSDLLDRPATAQITSDLVSDEKHLVISIADDYGLSAADQAALTDTLNESYPGQNVSLAESSVVEPFFGQAAMRKALFALLLASGLVVVYVWIRFRKIGGLSAGIMALTALFHDVLVVFFTCVLFKIPIGDSFLAVALTIIGYSINDTIVIYDRIRENSRLHKKLPVEDITNLSISQSLTRSINTNLAVTISVFIVYVLAFSHNLDSIQHFALPMIIGSISGCYSTLCIAGPLWAMWQKRLAAAKKHPPKKSKKAKKPVRAKS